MYVADLVRGAGRVAHRSTILAAGVSANELARAVHVGALVRVRRAWYATPDAPTEVVRAVKVGGAITAVSAAKHLGLWTLDDAQLHVSVARNASRLRTVGGMCIHWRRSPGADLLTVRPIIDVLVHSIECQTLEHAVILIDSAIDKRLVTLEDLHAAFAHLPRKYRRALAKAEPGCQSGTETLVRLRLRALGMKVRIQVDCNGPRVDVLVGERLVIECHSRKHHTGVTNYANDRRRELALLDGNYVVMTLSYEQVLYDWPAVEAVIRRKVAAREHLWPRTSR